MMKPQKTFQTIIFVYFTELWRGDVTNRMNIGVSASGFHQIRLDCSNNRIDVLVDTDDEFHGVIYTRGSLRLQS